MSHPPPGAGVAQTLLVVENEAAIRNLLQMALERAGYTVHAAASGNDALTLVSGHDGLIDLLITDVVMPDMNGPELVRKLALVRPGIRTLFMSGYLGETLGDHGVLSSAVNFIQKPFSPRVFVTKVREILDGGRSAL